MAFCKNCGERLDNGERFCTSCGTKVDDGDSLVVEVNENIEEQPPSQKVISAKKTVDLKTLKKGLKNIKKTVSELLFEDDSKDDEEIKKKKHKKEIRSIVIGLIVLLAISWIGNNLDLFGNSSEKKIFKQFETFSPTSYPDVSYVDAFALYFSDGEWNASQTEKGAVVEFNGKCFYNDRLADICVQFTLEGETGVVSYMDVNGQSFNMFAISNLMQEVFENAYQEKGLSLYNSDYDYSDPSNLYEGLDDIMNRAFYDTYYK